MIPRGGCEGNFPKLSSCRSERRVRVSFAFFAPSPVKEVRAYRATRTWFPRTITLTKE
jgi:hypothetical protein